MSLSKTGIPYGDLAWNPCGAGCSNVANCPTCWARAFAARGFAKCPDCTAFRVHFHPERLDGPSRRKKPATILVQFTGDLFDRKRHAEQTYAVLNAAYQAPQHTYVFLTQQPHEAHRRLCTWLLDGPMPDDAEGLPDNWFIGTTLKHDMQARHVAAPFNGIPGRRWLSLEPLYGVPDLTEYLTAGLDGVVIGADNQPNAPFDLAWVNRVLDQVNAANLHNHNPQRPIARRYVKQVWLWRCPNCGDCIPYRDLSCGCGTPASERLYSLITDATRYLPDLNWRDLPWTLATATKTTTGGLL